MVLAKNCSRLQEIIRFLERKHGVTIKLKWKPLEPDVLGEYDFIRNRIILDPEKATIYTVCHETLHRVHNWHRYLLFSYIPVAILCVVVGWFLNPIAYSIANLIGLAMIVWARTYLPKSHSKIYSLSWVLSWEIFKNFCTSCEHKSCREEKA